LEGFLLKILRIIKKMGRRKRGSHIGPDEHPVMKSLKGRMRTGGKDDVFRVSRIFYGLPPEPKEGVLPSVIRDREIRREAGYSEREVLNAMEKYHKAVYVDSCPPNCELRHIAACRGDTVYKSPGVFGPKFISGAELDDAVIHVLQRGGYLR
jgi:hypothetical protein